MLPPDLVAKLSDCAKHDFVSTRDFWFLWLSRGTRIVAAGLLLEAGELWYEFRSFLRDRMDFFKYRIVIMEHRVQMAKMAALVGWILIVGGVVTEWASEVRVKDADANIQECSDAKVQEATLEAGDAAKSAKDAEESAQRAKTLAKETAEYAAWRTISEEQAKLIRTYVGSSLNGHTLVIQANPDEAEIWAFANGIAISFGMMRAKATVWPQGWIVPTGLKFSIGKNRQRDFDLMVKALDAAGVDKATRLKKQSDHKNVADDDLLLTVGPRH